MTSFTELGVPARLAAVLTELGFDTPTPIQQATLPDAFAGRDLLGRGRTGSGKTLAFLLPLVGRLSGPNRRRPRSGAPRAMILAPTRELVAQIDAALQPLAKAAGLTSRTVFGGVGQGAQVAAIRRGTDILVACPGRLEDLIEQGLCSLSDVEISVLDEADHMADLGFLPAVRRLLAGTPAGGQRMLFSATLDRAVDALVRQFLVDPQVHQADSAQSPVSTMSHHVLQVTRENRLPILIDLTSAPGRTVVFTRTKHGAKGLARKLNRSGVPTVELHGNLAQNARTRNLEAFHSGKATTLVATDIAARGIHVDHVALVIHADPPVDPKAYLHRSGRTARAGNSGSVITLATPDQANEVRQLTRSAGITPTTTKITTDRHAVLSELAPGPRVLTKPVEFEAPAESQPVTRSAGERQRAERPAGGGRGRRRGAGRGRGTGTAATAERETKTASRPAAGGRSRGRRRSSGSSSPAASPTHSAAAFSARRR
ncbi:DEAD/DEAH box helicase [Microlunatus parietis]|uniref:Superfamily II DNA/RNA helicase n=1 Tax=Microlunatus parietis TaxID=682979 RepID=A0A7Y9I667_9ACTN|nr:DEAD/DEAH box helicase [Microlunatus parietis]NYE70970.1 superfamily II DNA/RNA helicase [Microlunatus parietis]